MQSNRSKHGVSGLTMIELVVAVAILVIVMLAFGSIITQIQGTVATGQRSMRSNAAAAAIIDSLQGDIRRATQQGMLCITQIPDGPPAMFFTIAGPTPSKTHPVTGTGAIIALGMAVNHDSNDRDILYCQRWVLGSVNIPLSDILDSDLIDIQAMTRWQINNNLINSMIYGTPPEDPSHPRALWVPHNPAYALDNINALWQVLADNCQWLSIMWTDGEIDDKDNTDPLDDGLAWYGIAYDQGAQAYQYLPLEPDPPAWTTVDAAQWAGDLSVQEFAGEHLDTGVYVYRAMWTHHNQNNWPKAVKLRFGLLESGDTEENVYEVICPVGS